VQETHHLLLQAKETMVELGSQALVVEVVVVQVQLLQVSLMVVLVLHPL
jgi:hypothetical protein